jgi:hypothetical protein
MIFHLPGNEDRLEGGLAVFLVVVKARLGGRDAECFQFFADSFHVEFLWL